MTRHVDAVGARANSRLPRRFLIAAFCTLLSAFVLAGPSAEARQQKQIAGSGGLARAFQDAANRWDVPMEILLAVGYVESRWQQRGGEPSLDHGYGIMHVTDRPDGTLQRAVELTGHWPEAIRSDPAANIDAGAAILRDISHEVITSPVTLTDWYAAVAEYSGAADERIRDGYALDVFRLIAEGVANTGEGGEVLVLAPTKIDGLPQALGFAPQSEDYPPALWVPAHPNNYTVGRPYPPLNTILIHDTEGSYASAISWFQNPNSRVSAHYVLRSADGQVTQMVREANTAWHAGNWDYNVRSIGLEHEGYMN
ncbi:MAG TPA: N-acetylmuramoyl-L-alanine amidase, partial [Chloroflexia bacterium]|nr:N-acetylmuramoyl-L-alanine amidase [Chloroflexia bacterium]